MNRTALTVPPAVEGGFASCNPRTQILAGPDALVAGVGSLLPDPGGLILGRFGFADLSTGKAYNVLADAGAHPVVGLVVPTCGTWQRIYWYTFPDRSRARVLRSGLAVTLLRRGDVWVKFPGGAWPGQDVYASQLDGSAIGGYSAGAVLTPWSVIDRTDPGCLGRISTWSNFT